MNPIVQRIVGTVLAVLLLVLWLRVEPAPVPAGGDAFADAAGGRAMAVAAAQNADELADLLVAALFGEPANDAHEGQRQWGNVTRPWDGGKASPCICCSGGGGA